MIELTSIDDFINYLIDEETLSRSKLTQSRCGDCYDFGPYHIKIPTTTYQLPITSRIINPLLPFVEAILHNIGMSKGNLKFFLKIFKNYSNYVEPKTNEIHGFYGCRIPEAINSVVGLLHSNKNSRRGYINLWDNNKDLETSESLLDVPCTTGIQFKIKDHRVEAHVDIRSCDLLYGLTFTDILTYSFWRDQVATRCNLGRGPIYLYIHNLHAYKDAISKIKKYSPQDIATFNPSPILMNIFHIDNTFVAIRDTFLLNDVNYFRNIHGVAASLNRMLNVKLGSYISNLHDENPIEDHFKHYYLHGRTQCQANLI